MSPEDYMALSQMQGQPVTAGPAPAQPQNVSRGTMENPIGEGAIAGIQAAREGLASRPRPMNKVIGNSLQNIGLGMLRGDPNSMVRGVGQSMMTPEEQEAAQFQQNMAVMRQLQQAEAARQQYMERLIAQKMQQRAMEEAERHHRAQEMLMRQRTEGFGEDISERKQIEHEIYQKTGDHVEDIASMRPQMKIYSNKKIDEYIEKANSSLDGVQTAARMKEIAEQHPEILNNWTFVVANMYNQHPGFWQQAALNLKVPAEARDAFFEMASLTKHFNINAMKSIPSKGINQMIERELFSANPTAKMSQGALIKILDKAQEELEHGYQEYNKAADYGRNGFLYKPSQRKAKERPPTAEQHEDLAGAQIPTKMGSVPNKLPLSDEELDALIAQKQGQ